MHRNSRQSIEYLSCHKGLQHRADVVFTGIDCHEEIPSTVDGTLPLFVKSENAGEVAVRDKID
jgi:hypothetical protein